LVYHHQGKPKDAVEKEADLARRLADVLGGFSPDILSRVYSYHSYEACLSIVENYLGLGEAERAEKELNNLINLMKQNPPKDKFIYWSAYNILGYCLFQRKDYDSALKSFKQSLDIEPNQPRADITHSNLGMIYLEKGNLSEAKKEFEKTLKINPDNETAKDYLNKLSDKL
jgi:tetratricopeptide (TPR) repeat protein